MSTDDKSQQSERGSAGELLRQGLQAVALGDWAALRSLVHDDVVWEIPGRSPLAGRLAGPEAIIERFQLMRSVTADDRPAELVGVLEGGDYAAAVQRNVIARGDGEEVPFTAITLVTARDGRVAALQYFVSDQYATDALWLRKLEDA